VALFIVVDQLLRHGNQVVLWTRRNRYGRLTSYVLSHIIPDDGNVSNVGDDSSEDGDAADTQSDSDTETETEEHTEESTDESEGMDADDDDGASASSSGTDTSGRTNPLVWSCLQSSGTSPAIHCRPRATGTVSWRCTAS